MSLKMAPITDKDGHLRPDMDFRDVPVGVMALYLGIDPSTVWKRRMAGHFPKSGIRIMGKVTYYRPRVICCPEMAS